MPRGIPRLRYHYSHYFNCSKKDPCVFSKHIELSCTVFLVLSV